MPRAVYERAVYERPNQLARNVYKRSNNVIPVGDIEYYYIKSVILKDRGAEYKKDDILELDTECALSKGVILIDDIISGFAIKDVSVNYNGTGYKVGEKLTVIGENTDPELDDAIIVIKNVKALGDVAELYLEKPGLYKSDTFLKDEVIYTYNGSGTGLTIKGNPTEKHGCISEYLIKDGGKYSKDCSGDYMLKSSSGTGALFSIKMAPKYKE